jgi:hypothetical protein
MHTCIHIFVLIYTYIYMYLYMYISVYVYIHDPLNRSIKIYIYIYIQGFQDEELETPFECSFLCLRAVTTIIVDENDMNPLKPCGACTGMYYV